MRKVFYVCVALLLIISCDRDKNGDVVNDTILTIRNEIDLKLDYDTVSIEFDSIFLFNYKKFSSNGIIYAGYNSSHHSIDLFDLEKEQIMKSISLSREGPESIGIVKGIFFHSIDSIFLVSDGSLCIFDSEGRLTRNILINRSELYLSPGNEANNVFFDRLDKSIYIQNIDNQYGQCSKDHYKVSILAKIRLDNESIELLPLYYPKIYSNSYYGFCVEPQYSFIDKRVILTFPIESSVYVYNIETKLTRGYGGESLLSKSLAEPLPWSACNDNDLKMRHFIENVNFQRVIYDKWRNLFYRFHLSDIKGPDSQGRFKGPNQKKQILTIFNENFEVLGEIELNERRYITPSSFAGPKGLYLGAPSGENSLRFHILKIV